MKSKIDDFCKKLDQGVDSVRNLTQHFRDSLNLTGFAYVRAYHDGRVSWVSSKADRDRLLIESKYLEDDPLIDTAQLLKEGSYLWFHNREFPGCEEFYRLRSQKFGLDHGLVVVLHQQDYLETASFSGCLAKSPLYNLFMNETGLFTAFLESFKSRLNKSLNSILEEGLMIDDIKSLSKKVADHCYISKETRSLLIASCGCSNLLKLSSREKQCLALLHKNLTCQAIGTLLNLSPRTDEQYLKSIKTN